MNVGKKMLWGGLGWVLGGPIGAIIGYSLAGFTAQSSVSYGRNYQYTKYPQTQPGDFIVCLLVLFGAVMKADKQMLRSELDYIKTFLSKQFSRDQVKNFMILFKDIIKQEYPLRDVCRQIVKSMDHPSRLELIHILFELSQADGKIHPEEINVIQTISRYLNINLKDFDSIQAMFIRDTFADYKILGINKSSSDGDIKKAYRAMATKYHPDKVGHLGDELRLIAEEKFKAVNEAYQNIKKERSFK